MARVLEGVGLTTPPDDVDAFAQALVFLADNREVRLQMGQKAREYAIAHLDREEILLAFERLLLEVCGQPTAGLPAHLAAGPESKTDILT